MSETTPGAELLAAAVVERRRHLRLRQRDVERATGVSVAVQRAIEHAERPNPQRKTINGLDRALRWPAGATNALLDNGMPPYRGSAAVDIRVYAGELVSQDFRSVHEVVAETAAALRSLPNTVPPAELGPVVIELARHCNLDLAELFASPTRTAAVPRTTARVPARAARPTRANHTTPVVATRAYGADIDVHHWVP